MRLVSAAAASSVLRTFYNTIRGLDILELLGRCLHHEVVVGIDVTIIGEIISFHFCEPGVSFGLYTLFKNAGDKSWQRGEVRLHRSR